MSTGLKMAASALVSAGLTAALFLTFWGGSSPRLPSPPDRADTEIVSASLPPLDDDGQSRVEVAGASLVSLDLPPFRGDGTITGRVATAEGAGVGGVVITARPHRESRGHSTGDAETEPDLEEEIRRAVAEVHRRVTGTRHATTDVDGHYRLSGLGEGSYRLDARAEGYSIPPVEAQGTAYVLPGSSVDFVASAIVRVRFLVEGIDASASGPVCVRSGPDEEYLKRAGGWGWSFDQPVRCLRPGKHWLQATQGRNRELKSDPIEITLVAGDPETVVVLLLKGRPGIKGAIVITDQLDVQRLHVKALRFEGDRPPAVEGRIRGREGQSGRYDPRTGQYSITELEPGRYFVWVTFSRTTVMGSAIVEVADRMVTQDIEVGIEHPECYVVVRVLGPDGEPLEAGRTRFHSSFKGPGASVSGGGEVIHRQDGSWLLAFKPEVPRVNFEMGGTYRLRVTHPSFGSREVAYDPATDRELTIHFGEASSLVVGVQGRYGGRHLSPISVDSSRSNSYKSTPPSPGPGTSSQWNRYAVRSFALFDSVNRFASSHI